MDPELCPKHSILEGHKGWSRGGRRLASCHDAESAGVIVSETLRKQAQTHAGFTSVATAGLLVLGRSRFGKLASLDSEPNNRNGMSRPGVFPSGLPALAVVTSTPRAVGRHVALSKLTFFLQLFRFSAPSFRARAELQAGGARRRRRKKFLFFCVPMVFVPL